MGEQLTINRLGQWTLQETWNAPSLSKSDVFFDDLDLFEPIELLQKIDKKVLYQIMGDTPEAKATADWARKSLKREDMVLWFARAYKNDPSIDTPTTREQLQHYMGMTHLPGLGALRLSKEHDFDSGMQALAEAEKQDIARQKEGLTPAGDAKKIVDAGNGLAWYSLGRGYCPEEGAAMGHCGNAAHRPDDDILSLRSSHSVGGQEMHKPYLTFINNHGYLGEMKGRANNKPSAKYHDAIMKLLTSPEAGIKHIVGGGYRPDNNFQLRDLSDQQRAELLAHNPKIDLFGGTDPIDVKSVPDKHAAEAHRHNAVLEFANSAVTDPKKLASTLSGLSKSHNWNDRQLAEDFAKSAKMTPAIHQELLRINKSHSNRLASLSPHFTDEDARTLLLNPKKHPLGWDYQRLLQSKHSVLDDAQLSQLLSKVKPGHTSGVARAMKDRGLAPSKADMDKLTATHLSAIRTAVHNFPEHLTRDHAEHLMKHPSLAVVRALAFAAAPYAVKAGLENHPDRQVRQSMAARTTDLPPDVLEALSKDPHAWVRSGVSHRSIEHPAGVPDHIFDRLAGDRSKYVRRRVFGWSGIGGDKVTSQLVDRFVSHPNSIKNGRALEDLGVGHSEPDGKTHHDKVSAYALDRLVAGLADTQKQVVRNRSKWQAQRGAYIIQHGLAPEERNDHYSPYHIKHDNWIRHGGTGEHAIRWLTEHPKFGAEHAAKLANMPLMMQHLEHLASSPPSPGPYSAHAQKIYDRNVAALNKVKQLAQSKP